MVGTESTGDRIQNTSMFNLHSTLHLYLRSSPHTRFTPDVWVFEHVRVFEAATGVNGGRFGKLLLVGACEPPSKTPHSHTNFVAFNFIRF